MKIIDSHVHIGQWSEVFLNYSSTVPEAIEIMKSSGIDEAICMPADLTKNSELFKETVGRDDYKFYYNAWIDPGDEELDVFLNKNLSKISLFKIHPSIVKKPVTDITYSPYLQIAQENNIPVIVHCGRWQEMSGYKLALEVSLKYPELKLILAHLGGDTPALVTECSDAIKDAKYKNIYLGTESIREFYFVNKAVRKLGADRFIFGSDYNLCLPRMFIEVIDRLDINNSEKELIFSGNILRLLNN